jgi:hypothetical protein
LALPFDDDDCIEFLAPGLVHVHHRDGVVAGRPVTISSARMQRTVSAAPGRLRQQVPARHQGHGCPGRSLGGGRHGRRPVAELAFEQQYGVAVRGSLQRGGQVVGNLADRA